MLSFFLNGDALENTDESLSLLYQLEQRDGLE